MKGIWFNHYTRAAPFKQLDRKKYILLTKLWQFSRQYFFCHKNNQLSENVLMSEVCLVCQLIDLMIKLSPHREQIYIIYQSFWFHPTWIQTPVSQFWGKCSNHKNIVGSCKKLEPICRKVCRVKQLVMDIMLVHVELMVLTQNV